MLHQKDNSFKLRVNVETISEHCTLRNITFDNKVCDLKEQIETIVGIPRYL